MIQEYIEFAIENGYNMGEYQIKNNQRVQDRDDNDQVVCEIYNNGVFIHYNGSPNGFDIISLEKLITSKEFIEAIARGLEKKMKWDKIEEEYYIGSLNNKKYTYNSIDEIIDDITHGQAEAIRDNTLDTSIKEILSKK